MKLREILRFEFKYQARRVSTWVYFVFLAGVTFLVMGESISDARSEGSLLHAPWIFAGVVVFLPNSLLWLLVTAIISGAVATRDVRTRMHPLTYTAPVRKIDYLGGRFLAAFMLNALLMLALPLGALVAVLVFSRGVDAALLGPFRPAAYLMTYAFIVLPNACIVTAIQFSFAVLSRRAIASYLASILILVGAVMICGAVLAQGLGLWEVAKLLDPISVVVVGELSNVWTTVEKNTVLIGLQGWLLVNRLIWLSVALACLAFTHFRFRFGHHSAASWWSRLSRRHAAPSPKPLANGSASSAPISNSAIQPTFSFTTQARQTLAIAWTSFAKIIKSRGGFVVLAVTAALAALAVLDAMDLLGVPLLPRTEYVLTLLTTPQAQLGPWIIIPILIIFWTGELVWRERETGLSEIMDAAPVPDWVLLLGKFLGLALWIVAWTALLTLVGILVQAGMGYHNFEVGRYLQILFGLQLADYLLFAMLAFLIHVLVNHKHIANLVALVPFVFLSGFHLELGIEHNLLVYGSDPGWSYTDMRGFGSSLGPWLWFKLGWAAWALLLAVIAKLLWVRGREQGLRARLRMARRRFTRATAWTTVLATVLIIGVDSFIFYNTNVLNTYANTSDAIDQRAEYERRYGQYEGIPQPRLTSSNLDVEIYAEQHEMQIRGTYDLVNNSAVPIEAIHLATAFKAETEQVAFDRPATLVLADQALGHQIYALQQPLQPDEALQLSFEIRYQPRGFGNHGIDESIAANGTYFTNQEWLPAIGYQPNRELSNAEERQAHGLAPRPVFLALEDIKARQDSIPKERITFQAVVGTDQDQIAVAPGVLRETWTEGDRRYFRYSTDAPIGNEYAIFSARYAVREAQWNNPDGSGQVVAIRIFHHPEHAANLDRMLQSVQASLSYYTQNFGPYPQSHLTFVEHPGDALGMHAEATLIDYEEGFALLHPEGDPHAPDLLFSVVAHETAHQWWGSYLAHTRVEGAILFSETLAQYSAYQVVKQTYGEEHLRRLILSQLNEEEETPRKRAAVPLLRATDQFLAYRKGPLALYALSTYIGEERVNQALRRLLAKHAAGAPTLLTSLDLYQELQRVTPAAHQYLLHDLFEANTYWELQAKQAAAEQTQAGMWQIAFDVQARKVVVDTADVETPVPMDDWVEIAVFARAQNSPERGAPLYRQMHRIRSGAQTITITVQGEPAHVGLDPYHLLIDTEMGDNLAAVKLNN